MPKRDTLWGTRAPGQVTLAECSDPSDSWGEGSATMLFNPTGEIDWLRLPGDPVLGDWGDRAVRVLRSERSGYCAVADHLSLWHWTEAPFVVIECPQCGQFQTVHKPDSSKGESDAQ